MAGEAAEEAIKLTKPLKHIAFIMDGNGRWAHRRLLPRSLGHKAGVRNVKTIVDLCFKKYGINVCSLYVFSTENWNRPDREISYLFRLLELFFRTNIEQFKKDGVRVLVSGDLNDPRIPPQTKATIREAISETERCNKNIFNVLYNYGGRKELARAARLIAQESAAGKLDIGAIDEKCIQAHLYQPELPDVDLLVRTSGELRISNCLLFESAYAEFVFPKACWPEFDRNELDKCIKEYEGRHRRFGGLKDE